jgi:hypothetical protein
MGARSEALAKQFESKAREALATLQDLSDAEWKKVTEAEKWPVGVTAHHLAGALEPVSYMVRSLAAHESTGTLSAAMLDEMNARHAQEFASCTKAETVELHQRGMTTAAATIRALSDDQLAISGTVLIDVPPMTAEELIARGLLQHIDEHFGSIRRTVGR